MFRPFGLPSENRTVEWHPEPTTRGTFSLVSTCLITMGLCIWTAVHLNIPGPGEHIIQFRRKVLCVLIGLFAPELIAWTAYEQYKTAQMINQSMLENFCQSPTLSLWRRFLRWVCTIGRFRDSHEEDASKSSEVPAEQPNTERHPWTFVHSQYAAMGGYAMVPSHSARRIFPGLPARFVLQHGILEEFAQEHWDLLPDISENNIRDKSKASALAKILVCIQAGWFCIQCIARLSQGLTISLLELNTFAHAICAFLVYLLWWYKPLDIEEPTMMQGELLDALQMALWVPLIGVDERVIPLKHDLDHLMALHEARQIPQGNFHWQSNIPQSQISWLRKRFRRPLSEKKNVWAIFRRDNDTKSTSVPQIDSLRPKEMIHGWRFDAVLVGNEVDDKQTFPTAIKLDTTDEEKLRLLNLAYNHFSNLSLISMRTPILRPRTRNTPTRSGFRRGFSLRPMPLRSVLGLTTAGLLYGGLHLLAWNAVFSTPQQLLLWRMSGLILISSGFALGLLNIPMVLFQTAKSTIEKYDSGAEYSTFPFWPWLFSRYAIFILAPLCYMVLVPCWILYIFARVYLVVECFLTLRHLPPSVFEVPVWSQYIPHIV